MVKEEELEFISVQQDDDDNMTMNRANTYNHSQYENTAVGGWVLQQSKHPTAVVFHCLFKTAAIFFYVFGSWFTSNFILTFVISILLLAFDFWTVKNISGRLLVGLRWWSYVREDGNNEWIFESLEDMAELSPFDSKIFWGALYITPAIWCFYLIVAFLRLKFEYIPIILVAIVMNMANIVGYIKCSTNAKNKMRSMVESGVSGGSLAALENSAIRSWLLNSLLAIPTNAVNNMSNKV